MKFSLLFPLFITQLAWGQMNEVECQNRSNANKVEVTVEENNFGRFKRAQIKLQDESGEQLFNYIVTTNHPNDGLILYMTAGFRLEIDLWPDLAMPRWGRNYRAILVSSVVNGPRPLDLRCRFPFARMP
jgi:hypothetical protein